MGPYIFTARTESEDSRGLLTYVIGIIHLLERKSLSLQDSSKVAIQTAYIWLVYWAYLKCKSQKGIAGFILPLFSMQHINRKPVYRLNTFFMIKLVYLVNSVCSWPVNIEFTRFAIEQLLSFHLYCYICIYMDTTTWFYYWTSMLSLW